MSTGIEIRDLFKTYNDGFEALKGISLSIKSGEFFGLLGPNGAGKSTTIGIISSLINKTSGSVVVCGHDIDTHASAAKQRLGIVPQEFNFNIFEPCYQIVVNQAGYYGVERARAIAKTRILFEQLGLTEKWAVPAVQLSGGMKRRLMIARALVHEPEVLILDEPTAGVDISLRRSMWRFLEDQNEKGLTIILTTHYLEEAEALCERIAIIDQGNIIVDAPTQDALDNLKMETMILYCDGLDQAPEIDGFEIRKMDVECLEVDVCKEKSISELVEKLSAFGIRVKRVKNKANRLEELFVNLVGDNS